MLFLDGLHELLALLLFSFELLLLVFLFEEHLIVVVRRRVAICRVVDLSRIATFVINGRAITWSGDTGLFARVTRLAGALAMVHSG